MKNFFSHDEGARNDPKLIKVLMRLGQEGKGVYWDLVEMLYEQSGYLLLSECESYAFALRTKCELIDALIRDFGLFETDEEKFWSNSVLKRLDLRYAKSAKAAESAAKRWENANAMRTHSDGNAKKGKENKGKESNSSLRSELPPTPGGGLAQKKIEGPASASVPAASPTLPPVAPAPLPSPSVSSWPPPDPALPHPGVRLPFQSEAFAEVWGRWRIVATERGCGYRGAASEQESLMHLTTLSGVGPENESRAIAIVKQTLASPTWRNFYPIRTDAHSQTTIRTNRLGGADSSQRNKLGNPSFAGDVA
ncbi:MAG TPA: DUF4373 domain-containing protein [Hymenobacter sp.]|jgi:uncharacterized protein YdaU (DUF1376 family)